MSAQQMIAYAKGSFDGIEREQVSDSDGGRFVVIGMTESSLAAHLRYLRGYHADIAERLLVLRALADRGNDGVLSRESDS